VFNVTDGNLWFPFVTWSTLAHYKKNKLGDSGGLYATQLGLERDEYSSWGCLWEESCEEMKQQSKMACFRYSHVRGEFIFWKWSSSSVELTETVLDVWTVGAKFCDVRNGPTRPTYIDARDRNIIPPSTEVKYVFNRMHRDGLYRPAISGFMSNLGDDGCGVFHVQRDLQYLLEVTAGVDYFMDRALWISPTKIEMLELPAGNIDIPITVPLFPKRNLECSSLALTFSWCGTSALDMDLVLFKPNPSSDNKMFDPDTGFAVMNSKRVSGKTKTLGGLNQDDLRASYSIELEMDDDGNFDGSGARSYGPETIYMFGDLPEGTYAVMAYVFTNNPKGLFTGGCERISLWSGMEGRGRDKQLTTVYIDDKKDTGNWWHALNIRISHYEDVTDGEIRNLKKIEYGIIDKMYYGPSVCDIDCGVGGNADMTDWIYRPTINEMLDRKEWRSGTMPFDPREATANYKTLMMYDASTRQCELTANVEFRALDALTSTYLTDATFRIDGLAEVHQTFDYRIKMDKFGGYSGGFVVKEGTHVVEVNRAGYNPQILTVNVPAICEGGNCLPDDTIYRELYMVPSDGKTRAILNWGDVPKDLDILVKPVGVLGLSRENVVWENSLGNNVRVYGYEDPDESTSDYGVGREPYASWNLQDFRCACEYICPENPLTHPFVCTHDPLDPRDQCEDYEATWDIWPSSVSGQAPLCVLDATSDMRKAACCCNAPNEDGVVTCVDGASDAWCCPKVEEIPGSLCQPGCAMRTSSGADFETTISIDRDEAGHNTQKPDTGSFYVNRPELATMSNLLPGMYKVYANAYGPVLCRNPGDVELDGIACDSSIFGKTTEIGIYLGNGVDQTVMVDTISLNRGPGKWLYAGYIMVTDTHKSCRSPVKMLQATAVNGKYMCYTWFAAGYSVSNPLALRYGAISIRISSASGRSATPLPDFTGVQYSLHRLAAGDSCNCTVSANGDTGCRCFGSVLVHAGILGPTTEDEGLSEGWAITDTLLFFPVENGSDYSMILRGGQYFDQVVELGKISPHPLGEVASVHSAVMIGKVDHGELRIVFSWKQISDGDIYIFKDPIPGHYESESVANTPFIFWDDTLALPGVELQQDCTTKECGVETIFFSTNDAHIDATYSVAVSVYAGINQSDGGKCALSTVCSFQGKGDSQDEVVDFFDHSGRTTSVSWVGSGAPSDWWLVAKVRWDPVTSKWLVESDAWNTRAYCTPNVTAPSIPSFMSPECVV